MEIVPLSLPNLQPIYLIVDSVHDKVIAPFVKQHKIWEPFETQLFLQMLKPGYVVLDIGANVGYYTLMFSQLVGANGRVIAFEPEPRNYNILVANVLINHCANVICERKAVSDTVGSQTLYLSPFNLGDHRLFPSPGRTEQQVETVVLNDIAQLQTLDFVKIDTQGSEPKILTGMTRLIQQNRERLGCLMEFCPGLLERSGSGLASLLNLLQQHSARVYWLQVSEKGRQLLRLENPHTVLQEVAARMLQEGPEDLSHDILVFFSEAAERRHLG